LDIGDLRLELLAQEGEGGRREGKEGGRRREGAYIINLFQFGLISFGIGGLSPFMTLTGMAKEERWENGIFRVANSHMIIPFLVSARGDCFF
jgi:hypothetical protein